MNRLRDEEDGINCGGRNRGPTVAVLVVVGIMLLSCGLAGPISFDDWLNQATRGDVESRYGPPHAREPLGNGGEAWTYFDRGSATTGFAGTAKSSYCRAYILSFDQKGVLRAWNERSC